MPLPTQQDWKERFLEHQKLVGTLECKFYKLTNADWDFISSELKKAEQRGYERGIKEGEAAFDHATSALKDQLRS